MSNKRDEFIESVKRQIAARVNYRCSNPACRAQTSGPQLDPTKSINVGVAAHITAASPGGPRYNPTLTPEERKHANNAIWLCHNHGKIVDSDEASFTVEQLREWKRGAEAEALVRLGTTAVSADPTQSAFSEEELILLKSSADDGEIFLNSADEIGRWVAAGSQNFLDQTDPAVAALYLDAFQSLQNRGLVRLDGGTLYTLTGKGFKIARALKQQDSTT